MAVLNQNLSRAFDLFELKPANEISFLRLLREDVEQVLRRPIETTGILGKWPNRLPRPQKPVSGKLLISARAASFGYRV